MKNLTKKYIVGLDFGCQKLKIGICDLNGKILFNVTWILFENDYETKEISLFDDEIYLANTQRLKFENIIKTCFSKEKINESEILYFGLNKDIGYKESLKAGLQLTDNLCQKLNIPCFMINYDYAINNVYHL